MSEFDKLKDDAEQYAKDHPEQVQNAEQDAEKKLGLPEQGGSDQAQGNQPGQDAQGQAQADQDGGGQDSGGQDSAGQGQ